MKILVVILLEGCRNCSDFFGACRSLLYRQLQVFRIFLFKERLWKLHRPPIRSCGRRSIELSVDEICDSTKEHSQRSDNRNSVAQTRPGNFVSPGVEQSEHHDAQNSSMRSHAPFPDFENDHGILRDHVPSPLGNHVEKHISQTSSQKDSEKRGISHHISHLLRPNYPELLPGETCKNVVGRHKSDHIGKPVPSQGNLFVNPKNDGVPIVDVCGK